MILDDDRCYEAISAKDARFDGRFFTAVTSTGIYCRPICPAVTPLRKNVRFYPCAAAAEEAGFRPCQRCRPEAAPGTPPWNGTSASVSRALRLIDEGALDEGDVPALARRLGLGDRQVRRLFHRHLGAGPLAIARTRRLHFARRLLRETDLSITEVAYAAGFGSLRRFQTAVRTAFHASPTEVRRAGRSRQPRQNTRPLDSPLELDLTLREPFAFGEHLRFLEGRAIPGVEHVTADCYSRTVALPDGATRAEVRHDAKTGHVRLRIGRSALGQLLGIVASTRRLFDLDADPLSIHRKLASDPLLGPVVQKFPGLRVPGAFSGFEVAVRMVVGQQVTVKAATTLCGRLARTLGRPLPDGDGTEFLTHLFPSARDVADARTEDLASLGMPGKRAEALRALAREVAEGRLDLTPSADIDAERARLQEIPGIGPWTAEMIALRVHGDPDAFPAGDLAVKRALGSDAEARSAPWRPWRAYAVIALWKGAAVRLRRNRWRREENKQR